jgi:hypothetical protein
LLIKGLSTFIGVTEEEHKAVQTGFKIEPGIYPTAVTNITGSLIPSTSQKRL